MTPEAAVDDAAPSDAAIGRGVGYLLRGSSAPIEPSSYVTVQLSCFVPAFDENSGAQKTAFICEDFVPIAK